MSTNFITADKLTNRHGIIAVGGAVETAGLVSFWRLSETCALEPLRAAWEREPALADLPLPRACSAEAALHRAVQTLAGKNVLARRLPKGAGWALVRETASHEDLEYGTMLRVALDSHRVPTALDTPVADLNLLIKISRAFFKIRGEFSSGDVSSWLARTMERLDAVRLRDTGGVYFVPAAHATTYRAVSKVIHEATDHLMFEIPAMRSDEAVDAILDAIAIEARTMHERLSKDLEPGCELGKRALLTRAAEAAAMEKKLERYEALLGKRVDQYRETLEHVGAQLVVAARKADTAEDGT